MENNIYYHDMVKLFYSYIDSLYFMKPTIYENIYKLYDLFYDLFNFNNNENNNSNPQFEENIFNFMIDLFEENKLEKFKIFNLLNFTIIKKNCFDINENSFITKIQELNFNDMINYKYNLSKQKSQNFIDIMLIEEKQNNISNKNLEIENNNKTILLSSSSFVEIEKNTTIVDFIEILFKIINTFQSSILHVKNGSRLFYQNYRDPINNNYCKENDFFYSINLNREIFSKYYSNLMDSLDNISYYELGFFLNEKIQDKLIDIYIFHIKTFEICGNLLNDNIQNIKNSNFLKKSEKKYYIFQNLKRLKEILEDIEFSINYFFEFILNLIKKNFYFYSRNNENYFENENNINKKNIFEKNGFIKFLMIFFKMTYKLNQIYVNFKELNFMNFSKIENLFSLQTDNSEIYNMKNNLFSYNFNEKIREFKILKNIFEIISENLDNKENLFFLENNFIKMFKISIYISLISENHKNNKDTVNIYDNFNNEKNIFEEISLILKLNNSTIDENENKLKKNIFISYKIFKEILFLFNNDIIIKLKTSTFENQIKNEINKNQEIYDKIIYLIINFLKEINEKKIKEINNKKINSSEKNYSLTENNFFPNEIVGDLIKYIEIINELNISIFDFLNFNNQKIENLPDQENSVSINKLHLIQLENFIEKINGINFLKNKFLNFNNQFQEKIISKNFLNESTIDFFKNLLKIKKCFILFSDFKNNTTIKKFFLFSSKFLNDKNLSELQNHNDSPMVLDYKSTDPKDLVIDLKMIFYNILSYLEKLFKNENILLIFFHNKEYFDDILNIFFTISNILNSKNSNIEKYKNINLNLYIKNNSENINDQLNSQEYLNNNTESLENLNLFFLFNNNIVKNSFFYSEKINEIILNFYFFILSFESNPTFFVEVIKQKNENFLVKIKNNFSKKVIQNSLNNSVNYTKEFKEENDKNSFGDCFLKLDQDKSFKFYCIVFIENKEYLKIALNFEDENNFFSEKEFFVEFKNDYLPKTEKIDKVNRRNNKSYTLQLVFYMNYRNLIDFKLKTIEKEIET